MQTHDARRGKSILITGVSGYFGRVLLPLIEQDKVIEQIRGIDRHPLRVGFIAHKLQFHLGDVSNDVTVGNLLSGADVLLHMAFTLMRRPGVSSREIVEREVRNAQRLFEAAAQQGVKKIIFTSSVVAYGLHPDNPVPLTEESPLRPNPGLYYGLAKAAIEQYLDRFEREHRGIIVTRLRPCTVVGPQADPAQMASLVNPIAVLVRGANPLYQLLHEDDMAGALHLAIQQDLPGVYNVASDGACTLRGLVELRRGRVISLPYFLVRSLMWALWRTGRSPFAPDWTDLVRYPLVASNDKLKRVGWTPRYTTPEALRALLKAKREGSWN